jgi:hypothetical protein
MNIKIKNFLAMAAGASVLLAMAAPPAQAVVPQTPLTCGMVVTKDTVVILKHDLTCATKYGVRVDYDEADDNAKIPKVTVDLHGHTLRGTGMQDSFGVAGFDYPSPTQVRVINGTVTKWHYAVGGDNNGRMEKLKLVGNQYAYFCNGGCSLTDSYVAGSTLSGMAVGGEANAMVKRTVFVGNAKAASVGIPNGLTIDHSVFIKNRIAIYNADSTPTVSDSVFIRNDVVVHNEGSDGCASLVRDTFIGNRVRTAGSSC